MQAKAASPVQSHARQNPEVVGHREYAISSPHFRNRSSRRNLKFFLAFAPLIAMSRIAHHRVSTADQTVESQLSALAQSRKINREFFRRRRVRRNTCCRTGRL
jgi:hypothetical protein